MIALIFLLAVLEPWVHGRSCSTYQHRSRITSNVVGNARAHGCNTRIKVGLRCCERNSCTSYCDNWNNKALPHEKKTGICKQISDTCRRPSCTFYEARQFCTSKGKSLCTKEQLSTICRETGCHHSFYQVWYPSSIVATCGTLEEDCPDCKNRDDERCITNGVDGICFQGKCAKSCQTFIFHGAAPEWEGNKDRKWDPILKMTNRVKVLENFPCALVISSVGFRCCEIAGSAKECRSICPVTATSSREFDNCRVKKNDRSSNKISCDTRRPSNHASAAKMCASQNMRLCRASEFQEEKCYFTGCNYDYDRVWVGQDICTETLRQNCVCGNKRVSYTGYAICKMDRWNHGSRVLDRAGEAESSSSGYSLVIVGISLGLVGMICSVGAYVLHRKRKTGNKDAMPPNQSSDGLQSSSLPHKSSRTRPQKQHSRVRGGLE